MLKQKADPSAFQSYPVEGLQDATQASRATAGARETFNKFRFNFVELETKWEFLSLLTEPSSISLTTGPVLDELESALSERKAKLRGIRSQIQDTRDALLRGAEVFGSAYVYIADAVPDLVGRMESVLARLEKEEEDAEGAGSVAALTGTFGSLSPEEEIQALKEYVAAQEGVEGELKASLHSLQGEMDRIVGAQRSVQEELFTLTAAAEEAEAAAANVVAMDVEAKGEERGEEEGEEGARLRDQALWYTSAIESLSLVSGYAVDSVEGNQLVLALDLPPAGQVSLTLSFDPETMYFASLSLSPPFPDTYPIALSDLLSTAHSLNHNLPFLLRELKAAYLSSQ